MTHELKKIVKQHLVYKAHGLQSVLATVVALDGSSYRRPGVRMLICENGELTGAVSGGCVEKEIVFQASTVFASGKSKMMTYDGRFRLGCEGILYILLEPFAPDKSFLDAFETIIDQRKPFSITAQYLKEYGEHEHLGSIFVIAGKEYHLEPKQKKEPKLELFEQEMLPSYKLVLVGGEHDAVQLSQLALQMGWEVKVCTVPEEEKTLTDFPGIDALWNTQPLEMPVAQIDEQTAVVLMTHSYVKDLKYLFALKNTAPMYFGLLGPSKRREKLFGEFIDLYPDEDYDFFDTIHGPAGLNIGAETPEEIAIAILSEILAVIRNQEPMMLKDKQKGIHH
ncbi:XshC-Cox1-family protein [Maribacter sp. 4U21]|uniref:XdhC family protein n=1 Tax=Maribacter sp. 4U21 TaxID=1889779 RepID=UPI000C15619A|nr:XdhC family protein [Maribacter sp. 4U21]PIB23722.1 XshC-Cox1-family protein [Maribacter sp. 4U21]